MLVPPGLRDYVQSLGGTMTGAYAVSQLSGNTVSIGANGMLARLRWAPSVGGQATFAVLIGIKVGYAVQAAITAAVQLDVSATVARAFTVDFTTAMTQISMTNNLMFAQHQVSRMGTAGPGICTTVVMSGQTLTADAAPFAVCPFQSTVSTNSVGAVVIAGLGTAGTMVDLYRWNGVGQHPVVLSANEGVIIRNPTAGPVSGAITYYVTWEWAEAILYI